ncbi:hypothetical protein NL676_010610 [Syzygium grande]|nr:hypothetical protein NL676_010610 [Syzygium grande]
MDDAVRLARMEEGQDGAELHGNTYSGSPQQLLHPVAVAEPVFEASVWYTFVNKSARLRTSANKCDEIRMPHLAQHIHLGDIQLRVR